MGVEYRAQRQARPAALLLFAAALSAPTAAAQRTPQPIFREPFAYDPAASSQLLGQVADLPSAETVAPWDENEVRSLPRTGTNGSIHQQAHLSVSTRSDEARTRPHVGSERGPSHSRVPCVTAIDQGGNGRFGTCGPFPMAMAERRLSVQSRWCIAAAAAHTWMMSARPLLRR